MVHNNLEGFFFLLLSLCLVCVSVVQLIHISYLICVPDTLQDINSYGVFLFLNIYINGETYFLNLPLMT